MRRGERFTLRLSGAEQQMLAELSRRLQRNRSDAVRLIIREALRGLRPVKMQGDSGGTSESSFSGGEEC